MERILANALGQEEAQLGAAEKRDLLARLLGRVAHEIRNPLSSLDIHVQLLEEDLAALAPASRQQLAARLEIIHGELHRLESIVENFLRLAGPSALDLQPVRVDGIVSHVCELLRAEAHSRQIELHFAAPADLPVVRGDHVRLTQALMNLVINAMQAIGKEGTIDVRAGLDKERLLVVVKDTGPGIPPEKLPSIFDPYFTTKSEGSGLGLWIAQQIVVAHGGTVQAQNAPQGGALFILALPLPEPAAVETNRHG